MIVLSSHSDAPLADLKPSYQFRIKRNSKVLNGQGKQHSILFKEKCHSCWLAGRLVDFSSER